MQINADLVESELTVRDYVIDFTRLLYMQNLEIDQMILNADQKAQVILGINAILIATLTNSSIEAFREQLTNVMGVGDVVHLVLQISTLVMLLLSIFYALWTVMPRYRPATRNGNPYFFGHIIQMSEADYVERYLDMSLDEVKESIMSQIHAKSFVIATKFRKVRLSMVFLALGIITWGIVTVTLVG